MNPVEFGDRLHRLERHVWKAHLYAATWRQVYGADQRAVDLMNRWKGLFNPALHALQYSVLMETAKLFDADQRTPNFRSMLNAAVTRHDELVPNIPATEFKELRKQLKVLRGPLDHLNELRDKALAHNDMSPGDLKFLFGELNAILTFAHDALNALTRGHHRAATAFEAFESDAERGFQGVVEALDMQLKRDKRRIAQANRVMREQTGEG